MVQRLDKFARRQGNGLTRTKAGAMLLEEALRESEFTGIEYRDSAIGRQPYMRMSGLTIWEVVMIARHYDFDVERMAQDYPYYIGDIKSALNYYDAYRDEIDLAIEDNDMSFEEMKRILPNIQLFEVTKEMLAEAENGKPDAVTASR
jgi:uncharacterized protein (DUF433 family)